jgi:hypothetical protein
VALNCPRVQDQSLAAPRIRSKRRGGPINRKAPGTLEQVGASAEFDIERPASTAGNGPIRKPITTARRPRGVAGSVIWNLPLVLARASSRSALLPTQ